MYYHSAFEKKMEQNLNRGMAISKWRSRALYYDLSEMTGLYVEGYAHLARNGRDFDGIAMRVLGVVGEERFKIFKLAQLVKELGCCGAFVFLLTLSFKGGVGCAKSRSTCCFR